MQPMKRCAYLVMDDPGDFVTDYHLSFDAMAEQGWRVECVSWRDPGHDWGQYDAVYICTPWDYPDDPQLFITTLEAIEQSTAKLINPMSLVRWSLAKTYLRELAERGGAVVPSLWIGEFDAAQVQGWFDRLGAAKVIIKPEIGTNSQHQFVLSNPVRGDTLDELREVYRDRPFFVQPFINNVQREGEYSLFFFGGEYSHAILKIPRQGDFRSQEEHGAEIVPIDATPEQVAAAERLLSLVDPQPAYVRVDLVRDDSDNYLLMELELIEPSLYLRMDAGSASRFARAFDQAASHGV
jgi:glutathione synthase/RimK-type ligase-like ATP-grasp enzyme